MIKIGLDLAFRTVGVAIISENKLLYTSHDLSSYKMPAIQIMNCMVNKVWEDIKPYIILPHKIVLEDIFKGKWYNLKNIARTQGAVIDRYIKDTNKYPELVLAITARNKLNIPNIAPKVAIQLWAIDKFKLDKNNKIDKVYRSKVDDTIQQYYKLYNTKNKNAKKQLKLVENILEQQTLKVEELTGLSNHSADAIVLATQIGI